MYGEIFMRLLWILNVLNERAFIHAVVRVTALQENFYVLTLN